MSSVKPLVGTPTAASRHGSAYPEPFTVITNTALNVGCKYKKDELLYNSPTFFVKKHAPLFC